MKIALYGATGTLGQRVLDEALQRGHTVTAVVRDPSRLTRHHPNLQVVRGDIFDAENVAASVAGHDAVLCAYGPRGEAPESVVEANRALIRGVRQAGVKRLVVIGGAGSLEVAPGRQLVDTPEFPAGWKTIALAHRDVLNIYRTEAGDLDWTYASPAALITPGERTGTFRLGGDQLLTDSQGESRISAEDFAIALLDELEHPQHIRQRFTVAY